MLVLLPPSRGQAAPERGRRMGLSTLVHPGLREHRARLVAAVDPGLLSAPALPACELYTGVLFAALDLASLPDTETVRIASALWGVLAPRDRIPAHRLEMSARPDGIGGLSAYWREPLARVLPDRPGSLVLDLRSGAYAAAWTPRRATHLTVRGFQEDPHSGERRVITHMVKRVRGRVARLVLAAGGARTPGEVLEIVTAAGLRGELNDTCLDILE